MQKAVFTCALMFMMWSMSVAADPVQSVDGIFPNVPKQLEPSPSPKADPNAVQILTPDLFYVVKNDTPFLLYASPPGLVTITKETGPLRLRGHFIDGNGKVETRTISAKNINIVEAVPGAKGRVELIYIPVGTTDESKAIRRMVDVNQGPQPPPETLKLSASPGTGAAPLTVSFNVAGFISDDSAVIDYGDGLKESLSAPVITKHTYQTAGTYTATLTTKTGKISTTVTVEGAVPVTSFRVIWVHESGVTIPQSQISVMDAKIVRDYLTANTTKDGTQPGFRRFDQNINADNDFAAMRDLWAASKQKITTVPCVIVEVNGKADILPFPASPADAIALFKKYNGGK